MYSNPQKKFKKLRNLIALKIPISSYFVKLLESEIAYQLVSKSAYNTK